MNIPSSFQDEASTGERAALDHFLGWREMLLNLLEMND